MDPGNGRRGELRKPKRINWFIKKQREIRRKIRDPEGDRRGQEQTKGGGRE